MIIVNLVALSLPHLYLSFSVSSHKNPENPQETQVIVGFMIRYVSVTTRSRTRTHNLFKHKCEPIPLGCSLSKEIMLLEILFASNSAIYIYLLIYLWTEVL